MRRRRPLTDNSFYHHPLDEIISRKATASFIDDRPCGFRAGPSQSLGDSLIEAALGIDADSHPRVFRPFMP